MKPSTVEKPTAPWFQPLPKPVSEFTIDELRPMVLDGQSPFHTGPHAKLLQDQWQKLKNALPRAERVTEYMPANALRAFEEKCTRWRTVLENIPSSCYTNPAFYSIVVNKLHEFDELVIVDPVQRTWTEVLVIGPPGAFEFIVLRKLDIPKGPQGEQADVPHGHEVFYDESTGRWIAERVNADGTRARIVSEARERRSCLQQLLDHATLRQSRNSPTYSN